MTDELKPDDLVIHFIEEYFDTEQLKRFAHQVLGCPNFEIKGHGLHTEGDHKGQYVVILHLHGTDGKVVAEGISTMPYNPDSLGYIEANCMVQAMRTCVGTAYKLVRNMINPGDITIFRRM